MAPADRPLTLHGPVMKSIVAGYLILAIGVVLGLALSYHASQRAKRNAACLSAWADETSARTAFLLTRSTERTDRLDVVIRDVASRSTRAKFDRDIRRYVVASDAYRDAVKHHPPPKPPSVRC
jgi:hypothetical protein